MGNTLISFSSILSTLVKNTDGNNSTAPLALRTSVSLSCLSLNTAFLATTQAALCTLKGPSISKGGE